MTQIKTSRPPEPAKQTGDTLTVDNVNEMVNVVNTNSVDLSSRVDTLQTSSTSLDSRLSAIENTSIPILSYTDTLPTTASNGTLAFTDYQNNMVYHKDGNWYKLDTNIGAASENFTLIVDTEAAGAAVGGTTFQLPLVSGKTYSFDIDWGDGNVETITSDTQITHDYGTPGVYTITCNGFIPGIIFNASGDEDKLIEISSSGGLSFDGGAQGAFWHAGNLTSVDSTQNIKTSGVTNFNSMYRDCINLTQIPWMDTTSGDNYQLIFRNCVGLTSLPDFDFGSPSVIKEMFFGMSNITSLDNLTIDVSNATDFSQLFFTCQSLTSIPDMLLDTSNASIIFGMFRNCRALTTLPTPTATLLNTTGITDFDQMFRDCWALEAIPTIDTSSGTDFHRTFARCETITSFPELNLSAGSDFSYTWDTQTSLSSFPALDLSSGTDFSYAWNSCFSLLEFPQITLSAGDNFTNAWNDCRSLTSFPPINLSTGTDFRYAWQDCWELEVFPECDFSSGEFFNDAWLNCNLNMTSIENILKSLVAGGKLNKAASIAGRTSVGISSWTTNPDTTRDALTNYQILVEPIGNPIHGTTGRGWVLDVNP